MSSMAVHKVHNWSCGCATIKAEYTRKANGCKWAAHRAQRPTQTQVVGNTTVVATSVSTWAQVGNGVRCLCQVTSVVQAGHRSNGDFCHFMRAVRNATQ